MDYPAPENRSHCGRSKISATTASTIFRPPLLTDAVAEIRATGVELLAVGVDVRNQVADLKSLPSVLEELGKQGVNTDVIFLNSSDEVLLQRYGETRRRHPLAEHGAELRAAIASERNILADLQNAADLIIDTSDTSVYELADVIRERVDRRAADSLSVLIESFGFKYGIPADVDFVFDMRCLPNPYWSMRLRGLTGRDTEVIEFLEQQDAFGKMFEDVLAFLQRWIPQFEDAQRGYLTIGIGCTGGQHRSVCMAEKLRSALRERHDTVQCRHNNLADHRIR